MTKADKEAIRKKHQKDLYQILKIQRMNPVKKIKEDKEE